MADTLTPAQRRKCMAANRGRNTNPERVVRSVLHRLGCRFSLHRDDLPGKPDIVMPARERIVLVHGCYWHMHACNRGQSTPATNAAFWQAKRLANQARDRRAIVSLRRMGWNVLVVWECQLRDLNALRLKIRKFLTTTPSHAQKTSPPPGSPAREPRAAPRSRRANRAPVRRRDRTRSRGGHK